MPAFALRARLTSAPYALHDRRRPPGAPSPRHMMRAVVDPALQYYVVAPCNEGGYWAAEFGQSERDVALYKTHLTAGAVHGDKLEQRQDWWRATLPEVRHEVIDAADPGVIALLEGGDGRVPSNEEMGAIVNLMARFESE